MKTLKAYLIKTANWNVFFLSLREKNNYKRKINCEMYKHDRILKNIQNIRIFNDTPHYSNIEASRVFVCLDSNTQTIWTMRVLLEYVVQIVWIMQVYIRCIQTTWLNNVNVLELFELLESMRVLDSYAHIGLYLCIWTIWISRIFLIFYRA